MILWDGRGYSIYLVSVSTLRNQKCHIVLGFIGVFWFVAWLFLGFDTPASHPRISPEEQHYIVSTIEAELMLKKSTFSKVTLTVSMSAS